MGSILIWLTAGAVLALWFTGRIRDWSVMTDELQYVKLALSVAETHSPLPAIHGASVAASNQLYPLLLAPVVGPMSGPDAFQAAHVLNAFLMTSAAIPAYLLGRELLDRTWSLVVAVSSVVMPWMVLTGVLMSEAAAYPAFLWATLAFCRAIVEPGPRRDLLALAALGLALLARTQFAVLLVALPIAILVHETVSRAAEVDGVRARLAAGAGLAARGHRVIWGVYAAGIAVSLATALAGHRLLGAYETTVEEGSPLPSGVWVSALRHLDTVGIGCGLLPLLLGGGWLLAAVLRPLPRNRHAYATLATFSSRVSRSRRRPSTFASAARRSSAIATCSTSSRCCSSRPRRRSPRIVGGRSWSVSWRSPRSWPPPPTAFRSRRSPACRSTRL